MPTPKKPKKSKPRPAVKVRATPAAPSDAKNPFAPAHWPFRMGETVYYVVSDMKWGGGKVATGTVHHYNPAVEGNSLITKGQPVVTINPGDDGIGNIDTVDAADVAPHTADGKAQLERRVAQRLLGRAAAHDLEARVLRKRAAELAPAKSVTRPRKAKR